MSQTIFKNPFVTSQSATNPSAGSLTVNKLTHFTLTQVYTVTCIGTSPTPSFSVTGSLDGPVGIATAGTQFFDQDLKIFFTIILTSGGGGSGYQVGDSFTLNIQQGTDLNQANIDTYDELSQKNFGPGVTGTEAGDASIRYSNTARQSYLYYQDLYFKAVTAGAEGINLQYLNYVPGVQAAVTIDDITYTAVAQDASGNAISITYVNYQAAIGARNTFYGVTFVGNPGAASNSTTIEYRNDGIGAPTVSVTGSAIVVHIETGVTMSTDVVTAVSATPSAMALLASVSNTSTQAVFTQTATALTGGSDAVGAPAGGEQVSVSGNAITIILQFSFSTAQQVYNAVVASSPASVLVTPSIAVGMNTHAQSAPSSPTNDLVGGTNPKGTVGAETVVVTSDAIQVYITSGQSTAQDILNALAASSPASALITTTVIGVASNPQTGPMGPTTFLGGLNKQFSLNHDELTDPSHFFEGNASALVQDMNVQGRIEVQGHTHAKGVVALDDSADNSGTPIANLQQFVNDTEAELKAHEAASEDVHGVGLGQSVVGTGTAQQLTNKDIDGGLASNTNRITLPKNTDTILEGLTRKEGTIVYDQTTKKPYYDDGVSLHPIGGGGGAVEVDLYDPVDTTLPSAAPCTIDGVVVTTGMNILFSNLSTGNMTVYEATVTGSVVTWAGQSLFPNGANPTAGDEVIVRRGTAFQGALGYYDFTADDFLFNLTVRHYNGTDYWEESAIYSLALINSQTNTQVFSVPYIGSENMIIDYSIVRGGRDTGTLWVTTDGTTVSLAQGGTAISTTGVTFSASISGSNLILSYSSDASGSGTLRYFVKRWSASAGGPGGLPSYSSSVSLGSASGADGDIQFASAGALSSDDNLNWNQANGILKLHGVELSGLSAPITLSDNVSSPATFVTYAAVTYPFAIIEFSVIRGGVYQIGRMLIANDGTTNVSLTVDSDSTLDADNGITFSASIDGFGNLNLAYVSTSTGNNATFKYLVRRWA